MLPPFGGRALEDTKVLRQKEHRVQAAREVAHAPPDAVEQHLSMKPGLRRRVCGFKHQAYLDSLQAGTSHFYAEIKRLRQLVDITKGELRLLFLLDEILHGTNSHDRRIGAEAVVRELVQRGAVGW
jgi:hypothetical protein